MFKDTKDEIELEWELEEKEMTAEICTYTLRNLALAPRDGFMGTNDAWNTETLDKQMVQIMEINQIEDISWETIGYETNRDDALRPLLQALTIGTHDDIERVLRDTWGAPRIGAMSTTMKARDLSVVEGVIIANGRAWIPRALMEDLLHLGHKGVDRMMSRAMKQCAYWPKMVKDIKNTRERCRYCNEHAPDMTKDEPIPPRTPTRPFEMIVADIAEMPDHRKVLVVADRYSGYVWAYQMEKGGTGKEIKDRITEFCKNFPNPKVLTWDNAANFRSEEIDEWAKRNSIQLEYSGAYHPAGNLHAEVNVKKVKRALCGEIMKDQRIHLRDEKVTRILKGLNNTLAKGALLPPNTILSLTPDTTEGLPKNPEYTVKYDNIRESLLHKLAGNISDTNQCMGDKMDEEVKSFYAKNRDQAFKYERTQEARKKHDTLAPGDEVWFRIYTAGKGEARWKRGLILSRGNDINARKVQTNVYDQFPSHHYLIWDIDLEYITSRDRCQIRSKYSNVKRSGVEPILSNLEKARNSQNIRQFFDTSDDTQNREDGVGHITGAPKEADTEEMNREITRIIEDNNGADYTQPEVTIDTDNNDSIMGEPIQPKRTRKPKDWAGFSRDNPGAKTRSMEPTILTNECDDKKNMLTDCLMDIGLFLLKLNPSELAIYSRTMKQ